VKRLRADGLEELWLFCFLIAGERGAGYGVEDVFC
jgi:hypothetical protein